MRLLANCMPNAAAYAVRGRRRTLFCGHSSFCGPLVAQGDATRRPGHQTPRPRSISTFPVFRDSGVTAGRNLTGGFCNVNRRDAILPRLANSLQLAKIFICHLTYITSHGPAQPGVALVAPRELLPQKQATGSAQLRRRQKFLPPLRRIEVYPVPAAGLKQIVSMAR